MDLCQTFAQDPERLASLSFQAPHVFADLSKNLLNTDTQDLLLQLAKESQLVAKRDAMLAGDDINSTEQRSVMHWLLRTPANRGEIANAPTVQAWPAEMHAALHEVHGTLDQMLTLADQVRD
ncbi:MAG: glucose-6-phosphate isomerase, partial [Comamonas sp.]